VIKHLWSILANEALVDQQTNSLSIVGVIEELTVQIPSEVKLPTLVPLKHTIVSLWQKERGKEINFELKIEIIGPTGEKLGEITQPVKILPQHRRMRTITQMDRFPLAGAGEYAFKISAKLPEQTSGTVYAELPLDVIIPKSEN
jgi:hypothetical protein